MGRLRGEHPRRTHLPDRRPRRPAPARPRRRPMACHPAHLLDRARRRVTGRVRHGRGPARRRGRHRPRRTGRHHPGRRGGYHPRGHPAHRHSSAAGHHEPGRRARSRRGRPHRNRPRPIPPWRRYRTTEYEMCYDGTSCEKRPHQPLLFVDFEPAEPQYEVVGYSFEGPDPTELPTYEEALARQATDGSRYDGQEPDPITPDQFREGMEAKQDDATVAIADELPQSPPDPDTTPPAVIGTAPTANATDVPLGTAVEASFNESVSDAQLVLKDSDGNPVPGTVTADNTTIVVTPTAPLMQASSYTAEVSGAVDAFGNAMTGTLVDPPAPSCFGREESYASGRRVRRPGMPNLCRQRKHICCAWPLQRPTSDRKYVCAAIGWSDCRRLVGRPSARHDQRVGRWCPRRRIKQRQCRCAAAYPHQNRQSWILDINSMLARPGHTLRLG